MPKGKTAAKKIPSKSKAKLMAVKKNKPKSGAMSKSAASKSGDGDKRKIRYRPGTVALREIKRYQKSTDFLLPRAPF